MSESQSYQESNIDMVCQPDHYNQGNMEVIEVIEAFAPHPHIANVIKYALRAEHKGKRDEDLKKGVWYLVRYFMMRVGYGHGDMIKVNRVIAKILGEEISATNIDRLSQCPPEHHEWKVVAVYTGENSEEKA